MKQEEFMALLRKDLINTQSTINLLKTQKRNLVKSNELSDIETQINHLKQKHDLLLGKKLLVQSNILNERSNIKKIKKAIENIKTKKEPIINDCIILDRSYFSDSDTQSEDMPDNMPDEELDIEHASLLLDIYCPKKGRDTKIYHFKDGVPSNGDYDFISKSDSVDQVNIVLKQRGMGLFKKKK